jgi:DNA-binding NarL/FixJ family response regulator
VEDTDFPGHNEGREVTRAGKHLVAWQNIDPAVTERLIRTLGRTHPSRMREYGYEALTERETKVLRLMTGGFSNCEIAVGLKLSEGTVKIMSQIFWAK